MTDAHAGPQAQPANSLPHIGSIVAVGAGKGGVGKSTAAALLAVGLQRRGASVGLLDADIYGPSIPALMGASDRRPEVDSERQRLTPVETKGVKIISIGLLVGSQEAIVWRGPMVHSVVQQFIQQVEWGPLDYLIIDLPPGTGDVPLTLSQTIPTTGSIIVCTPQDIALQDARRAVRMYQSLNVPSLGIIENMSYYLCPQCGHRDEIFDCGGAEQAAAGLGIPFLGAIPLNATIRRFCDSGAPEKTFSDVNDKVTAALDTVVENVVEQIQARQKDGGAPTLSID